MRQKISADQYRKDYRIAVHGIPFSFKVREFHIAVQNESDSQCHDARNKRRELKSGKHVGSNTSGAGRDRHTLEVTVHHRGIYVKTGQPHAAEESVQSGDYFTPPAQVCQGKLVN